MFSQQKEKQRNSTELLPGEIQRIVLDYCDEDDFKTLFRILPSAEDRKFFIGYGDYHQMDEELPTIALKVQYLNNLALPKSATSHEDLRDDPFVFIVNDYGTITDIDWTWKTIPEDVDVHDNEYDLDQLFWFSGNINWNAFRNFRNLQHLNL